MNTFCLDIITTYKTSSCADVVRLIQLQTEKAKKKHHETVEWRAYEFEKEKVVFLELLSSQENNECYKDKYLLKKKHIL